VLKATSFLALKRQLYLFWRNLASALAALLHHRFKFRQITMHLGLKHSAQARQASAFHAFALADTPHCGISPDCPSARRHAA
jgi:hypothetical protein